MKESYMKSVRKGDWDYWEPKIIIKVHAKYQNILLRVAHCAL